MGVRRFKALFSLLLLFTITFNLAAPVSYAQGPGEENDTPSAPLKSFPANTLDPEEVTLGEHAEIDGTIPLVEDRENSSKEATGLVTVVIWLEGDPAGTASAAYTHPNSYIANRAAKARADKMRAEQHEFSEKLVAKFGAAPVGQTTNLSNAVIMNMDASHIDEIKQMPGVRDAFVDQIGTLDNGNSVPFINAPLAWTATTDGYTGQGMRVGIIDSGIDYTHANFGGTGTADAYTNNDSSTMSDNATDTYGFDNSKVIGGYDFVGDSWTSGALPSGGATPRIDEPGGWVGDAYSNPTNPFGVGDNDPLDCQGHGSHVAGTAAGYGVEGTSTYTGTYPPADFSALTIGPGVAPEAELYAFKIGGCTSSVSFAAALLALEMVTDPNGDGIMSDRLDVVNNSYGSAHGSPSNMLTEAFAIASANDVVMVVSAGNEGDTFFVNGNPSVEASVISVAASVSDTVYNGLRLDTGTGGIFSYPTIIPAKLSQGGRLGEFGSYQLRMVGGADNSQGCSTADYSEFDGEAGLIVWTSDDSTSCSSGERMTNAVDALAVNGGDVRGLVIVTNNGDFPFISLACTYNSGTSDIPCVSITETDGLKIVNNTPSAFWVTFNDAYSATLDYSIGDMLASFSSRGPSSTGGIDDVIRLKPDVSAPGDSIVSTSVGTGYAAESMSGTSMAAPHVTGMVALLRQMHPDWSVAEIKALVMNTATHDLWTDPAQSGDNYSLSRVGAGRVDIGNAITSEVIAYDNTQPEVVSTSFGLVEVVNTVTLSRNIKVENLGSTPQTYTIDFNPITEINGVSYSVSPSQITVAGGSSQSITVTLTANKANMSGWHTPEPTLEEYQTDYYGTSPRYWISEAGGYVELTATTTTANLRVPVYAIVRPASDMAADGPLELPTIDVPGQALLELSGSELWTGTSYPYDTISQVSTFELIYQNDTPLGTYQDSAHIKYLGVTSDYPAVLEYCGGDPSCAIYNTRLYFAVVTFDNWNSVSGYDTYFRFGFDVNENDSYERFVYNFESGYLTGGDWNDAVYAWVGYGNTLYSRVSVDAFAADALDMYVMNTNVLVFPVWARRIGLTASNTDFQFDLSTYKNYTTPRVDYLPATAPYWFTYDVTTPTYNFSDPAGLAGGYFIGAPIWNDRNSTLIPVDYDVTAYGEGPYPPILLLHHHNSSVETRAELVEVVLYTEEDPDTGDEEADPGTGDEWGDPGTGDGVTILPATGYAPPTSDTPSERTLLLAIGVLAIIVMIGGVFTRRRA